MFRPPFRITLPAAGLALLAALLVPAPARAGANLLNNPGFETTLAGHSWMPAGWDTSWSTLPTVFFGRDTLSAHEGRYAVSVANVSTLLPLWHNWSQTLVVGPETWNKDLVFTAWTRSNGVQGRGYILLQAYRDTVGKMGRLWGVSRDTARARLGLNMSSDPYVYLGARREYFSDVETGWVRRQVRVFVPPSTNVVVVRGGLFGNGQVLLDDLSLTVETALPPPELPVGVNLLKDPGFEGNGDAWDYSLPPYDEMRCDRDSVVVHSGRTALCFSGGTMGMVKTRAGIAQVIGNRALSGKTLRLTGWIKCDSLMSQAYLKIYCTTIEGDQDVGAPRLVGNTTPWTQLEMVMTVPPDTYQVWAWLLYNAPSDGRVYFDDASLEIVGGGTAPKAPPKAAPKTQKSGAAGKGSSSSR
jgi:hypothetical protein